MQVRFETGDVAVRSIPKRLLWIILSLIILIAVVLIAGAPLSADGQPLLGGSCLTQADNPTRAAAAQLLAADDQSVDPYEGLLPAVDADSRLIEIRADSLGRPAAQDDLAARWSVDKGTVSRWLKHMRELGLVPAAQRVGRCHRLVAAE